MLKWVFCGLILLYDESGGSISGVREYVPGDNPNRIHWRSTAHSGKIIVKEYDLDLSEKYGSSPISLKAPGRVMVMRIPKNTLLK
jgi:hypothetical protein